ncbi:hypothetical protein HYW67_01225 [Candidatus Parcubacteria bacterium]|nr:hypothetical protein [Candidatus Parcubacteria bacterium]
MAGKGPYNEAQKQFVKDEVKKVRALGGEPYALPISVLYNEHFEPKREPYEIAALIRLLFPTGKRGRPPAAEPKRRGRPPGSSSQRRESTQQKQVRPSAPEVRRRGRALTDEEETEVALLAGEYVVQQIDVRAVRRKFEEQHPNRKGLPMSVFYNALGRKGVRAALKRGDPPQLAVADLPEDLVERAKVELRLIQRRQRLVSDGMERHRQEWNRLLGREEVVTEFLARMEKVEAFDESKPRFASEAVLAAAPTLDPAQTVFPSRSLDDAGFGYEDPGGHS